MDTEVEAVEEETVMAMATAMVNTTKPAGIVIQKVICPLNAKNLAKTEAEMEEKETLLHATTVKNKDIFRVTVHKKEY